MSIPSYEDIMLPLLRLLSDGKEWNLRDCEQKLAEEFKLSEEDLKLRIKSGQRVFYNRIGWAKTYLTKAGLIELLKKGVFKITERGKEVLKENPEKLDSRYLMKYEEFKDFIEKSTQKAKIGETSSTSIAIEESNQKTPFEKIEEAFGEIKSSLADELLQKLKEIDFYQFEDVVLDLLVKMGYGGSREDAKQRTKMTDDGGIDGIINEDRLGLDRIYIQAKRWQNGIVGRPEIQKFSGALDSEGASKGVFITTSKFSKEAIDWAKGLTNKKIILIDGNQLTEYMIEFNVGVTTQIVYEIKRIDNDYFDEEQ